MREYIVVIFLGILISLYFEDARQDRLENERKNKATKTWG